MTAKNLHVYEICFIYNLIFQPHFLSALSVYQDPYHKKSDLLYQIANRSEGNYCVQITGQVSKKRLFLGN